jgi:protein SCO1/2
MITGSGMRKSLTGLYAISSGIQFALVWSRAWICGHGPVRRERLREGRSGTCPTLCALLLLTSCAKHFPVRGMVIGVNVPEHTLTISHRDIPHYMPAMSMPFHVRKSADLAGLHPGAQVEFELVARKSGSYIQRLRRIGGSAVIEDQGDRIVLPPNPERVSIGSIMPDFTLTDQSGQTVRLSDFRGRVVAVDFIYTRCPLPDVCPRLSANFARLQNRFREKMGKDFMLLSITIDPQYDTPQVLLGYAKIWNARLDGWRFLTGQDAAIEVVARRFGMNYWPEEGLITHTSQTCVIGRDGKLAAQVDGSSFTPSQLGDLIQRELEKTNAP